MESVTNILYPVDFSSSCVAMAPYVRRAAAVYDAGVTLIHVFNPASYSGFEQTMRRPEDIAQDHEEIARHRLDTFLVAQFPLAEYPRVVVPGDPAIQIAHAARRGFDLIIMPTHAGTFRHMLLGSTTAKVLNDADCPVLTSTHAETIAPRPPEHRVLLCAVALNEDSERVLRYSHRAAIQSGSQLLLIHVVPSADPKLPILLDLEETIQSEERQEARRRIDELQQRVGSSATVLIVVGPIKEALLEAARQFDADALLIGRAPQSGARGRLRDLTYVLVRDSPFPVVSI